MSFLTRCIERAFKPKTGNINFNHIEKIADALKIEDIREIIVLKIIKVKAAIIR